MFPLLEGKNDWAVLRTDHKHTKRKGYESTEELNCLLCLTHNLIEKKIHPGLFLCLPHTSGSQRVSLKDLDFVGNRTIGMGD